MVSDSNIPPQEAARNQDVHLNKEAVKLSAFSSRGDARAPCCYCDWVVSSARNSHLRWYILSGRLLLAYLHKMSITFIYIYISRYMKRPQESVYSSILYFKEIHGLNRIGWNTSGASAQHPDAIWTPRAKSCLCFKLYLCGSIVSKVGVKNPRPFSRKYCKGLLSILQSNKYNLNWPVKDH